MPSKSTYKTRKIPTLRYLKTFLSCVLDNEKISSSNSEASSYNKRNIEINNNA